MSGRALRYLTQPIRSDSTESRPTTSGAGQFSFRCRCGFRSVSRRGRQMPVKAVALDRLATALTDRMLECSHRLLLGSSGARHVKDFFLQDRAMQIIHAVAERDLRQRQTNADPIGGEMVDIIEINAADGEITKLLNRRNRLYVREHRCLRFEGKWNEPCETTGLMLQVTQLTLKIDTLGQRLGMAVEDGASAAAPHLMPGPM